MNENLNVEPTLKDWRKAYFQMSKIAIYSSIVFGIGGFLFGQFHKNKIDIINRKEISNLKILPTDSSEMKLK